MANRNDASTARALHLKQRDGDQGRKLRTRTMIQCGGLLRLSGLLEQCDIAEGDDLQQDLQAYEKAATLLGILIDASEKLLTSYDPQKMEKFYKVGKVKLKQEGSKYRGEK